MPPERDGIQVARDRKGVALVSSGGSHGPNGTAQGFYQRDDCFLRWRTKVDIALTRQKRNIRKKGRSVISPEKAEMMR